jgi:CubicO group peptidase (beta-lactamase class C family)
MWRAGDDLDGRTAAIKALLSRVPAQTPGTFQHANTGYVTLGAALEHVTHKRWEELMRADVFAPLGMSSCGFGATSL